MNVGPNPAGGLVRDLPPELRETLLEKARRREYAHGTVLHRRGDTDRSLSVIESGAVQLSNVGKDGGRVTSTTLGPGESFGEFTLFAEMPRFFDMHARGRTTIASVGKPELDRLLEARPDLSPFIIRFLARRLMFVLELLDDERRLPLVARLAKLLLRMSAIENQTDGISVTQQELANELAVSRIALGGAIDRLRREGLVVTGYGRIRIPDSTALARWMEDRSQLVPLGPLTTPRRRT